MQTALGFAYHSSWMKRVYVQFLCSSASSLKRISILWKLGVSIKLHNFVADNEREA